MSDNFGKDPLPDPIIYEILTRLPAKTICRFKCVSKNWLCLTSTPQFIKTIISRSQPKWVIMDRVIRVESNLGHEKSLNLSTFEPGDISFLSITSPLDDPDKSSKENWQAVINSGCGLLLFAVSRPRDPHKEHEKDPTRFCWSTREDTLLICDPITRDWVKLPDPPHMLNHRGAIGFCTRVMDPNGFVVDFVVAEYIPIVGSKYASLLVFSSESCKWEEKTANYRLDMTIWRSEGSFYFDGCLFWVDLSFGMAVWDHPWSVEKSVRCRFIELPDGRRKPYCTPGLENKRCIGSGGGRIQYLEVFQKAGCFKVWRLNDHKEGGGKWGLVYKVLLGDVWDVVSFLPNPMLFNPLNAHGVVFCVGDKVYCVNVKTKKVVSSSSYSNAVGNMFVMPFVLPRWPTSFPSNLIAVSEKDRGNEYFKGNKFNEALSCYSRSISSSPTAVAYVNRAAVHLKFYQYHEAESDCTDALRLDETVMKAYARRAIARKELGKLEEAKEDAELALNLVPHQPDMLTHYAEIQAMLEKATIKEDDQP